MPERTLHQGSTLTKRKDSSTKWYNPVTYTSEFPSPKTYTHGKRAQLWNCINYEIFIASTPIYQLWYKYQLWNFKERDRPFICLLQLSFKPQGFELHRSTHVQISFNQMWTEKVFLGCETYKYSRPRTSFSYRQVPQWQLGHLSMPRFWCMWESWNPSPKYTKDIL